MPDTNSTDTPEDIRTPGDQVRFRRPGSSLAPDCALLNLASWRVKNQLAKRRRWDERKVPVPGSAGDAEAARQHEPPAEDGWSVMWDQEWHEGLLTSKMETVRARFSARQFQIFDLNAVKGWSALEVARARA